MKVISTCLLLGVASAFAAEPSLQIEAGKSAGKVSPLHYGLMTEEINFSYDGGLYGELVRNRSFLDHPDGPLFWSNVDAEGGNSRAALDPSQPLNAEIGTSLRIEVRQASAGHRAGIANEGYFGIPLKPSTAYKLSFRAKAAPGFAGPLTVSLETAQGAKVCATARISQLTGEWATYEAVLSTAADLQPTKGKLVIASETPGTFWLSLVSLFPPTWKDRPNGLRKDLMQMLVDMKPAFLRFPGGNYLEGDFINSRFKWKETLGPIEHRHGHNGCWNYRSSDGMGLMEFLLWCEDMGAEPVLAVHAGYSLKEQVKPGADMEIFIQEALEEIEYVSGPADSTWGKVRARDGHPEPFKLHYVEIGNEDWFDTTGSYDARYAQMSDAIRKQYPQLKLISTVGNEQPDRLRVHSRRPDAVDEHYYRPADDFLRDSPTHFDKYDRSGPEIFVGEWAAYETPYAPWTRPSRGEPVTPNMKAALADAAFMAAMERNSNLVTMQCYAPLLVNVSDNQWRPNLIGYDSLSVYGSPSYYAIKLFSNHVGDEILTGRNVGRSPIQSSVTRDSKTGLIYVKLVNPTQDTIPLEIALTQVGALAASAEVEQIAADPTATNSITSPTLVHPIKSEFTGVKPSFTYPVSPYSITVLTLRQAK